MSANQATISDLECGTLTTMIYGMCLSFWPRECHVTISGKFDPQTASMQVQAALATYITVLVNGGEEGGVPAADYQCRSQLKLLDCDDEYIASAMAYADKLGDEGWKKKYGYA